MTPTLSVDGFHARLTLVSVTWVTTRPVGWLGGVRSTVGGRGLPAAAGRARATDSATAASAEAEIRATFRTPMKVLLGSEWTFPLFVLYARIVHAVRANRPSARGQRR